MGVKFMIVEIISIGTEILLGDIVDTNSQYIADKLTGLGFDIHYITSVGDNKERVTNTLKKAIKRADIVITTGGLGPTDDDLTRDAIAEATGSSLSLRDDLLENIKNYFSHKGYKMTDNNKKQAFLPDGAVPLENKRGTAPGILLKTDQYSIISLPGVPREMEHIIENEVLPYLKKINNEIIMSKILNFFSVGESSLETKIKDILDKQDNPTLALLAGYGEVKLRITAKGKSKLEVEKMLKEEEEKIRKRVGEYIYGVNDKGLETIVGELLENNKMTLAVAESCTGGLVGNRITDVPGSSAYFTGGMVVYSNQAKIEQLGVNKDVLIKYGAVSQQTAKEMASNIRKKFKADIGLSLTGIAGPGGGTVEKPVGLVYIGLATGNDVSVYQLNLKGDRKWNKWMSSQYALYNVYKFLE